MSTDQRASSHPSAATEKGPSLPGGEIAKGDSGPKLRDPFATERSPSTEYLARTTSAPEDAVLEASSPTSDSASPSRERNSDRRSSKEWDASKVPPSRFQKREGSIFSTAGSRDSHVTRKDRDSTYHAKLKEKGWSENKKAGLW